MDKKEIKDRINQIEVPTEEVLKAIDRGIKQSNQMNIKRYSPKKKIIISSIVVASLFGITLSSGFVNPTMNQVLAKAPFIGGIYEELEDKMGMHLAQQNLVTELNQSVTKNGVTVKLTSAYFDGDVISITGHVRGDVHKGTNEKDEVSFDVNFDNNIGDNDPWLGGASYGIKNTEDGYIFQWTLKYPHPTIDNDFTLPISIHFINGIKGDWNFNIPITQMKNKTIAINHTESYENEGIQIKINEIKQAKASSMLLFETVSTFKDDQIDIREARDHQGNVVFHYENNVKVSQFQEEDGYHLSLRKMMTQIDEDTQSITFYSFMSIADPPVQQLLNIPSFILESERTDLKLKMNHITVEDDKLILDYQLQELNQQRIFKNRVDLVASKLAYTFTLIDKDKIDLINEENVHRLSTNEVTIMDSSTHHFQSVFHLNGENKLENFSLQDTVLQFDFSEFIASTELAPFTVELPKED